MPGCSPNELEGCCTAYCRMDDEMACKDIDPAMVCLPLRYATMPHWILQNDVYVTYQDVGVCGFHPYP